MASSKGKGKAVITIDGDSEEDLDFFTVKRRPVVRKFSPPRAPSPPSRTPPSDDEDSDSTAVKKKRRTAPRAKVKPLPAWTRTGSTDAPRRNGKRGSTEDRASRERSNVVNLVSDDEEPSTSRDKGKGKARKRHISLTPPPEISEERKAELRQTLDRHLANTLPSRPLDIPTSDTIPSSSPSRADDERIEIPVTMVADPTRVASDAAVKHYEKRRFFTVYKHEPLTTMYEALADTINKPVDDIVLVHDGKRILSNSLRPSALGLRSDSELKGYDKALWKRLQAEREARQTRELGLLSGSPPPDDAENDDPSVTTFSTHPATEQQPSNPPASEKVKLILRGAYGDKRLSAEEGVTASTILRYYCKQFKRPVEDAAKMRIVIDGEAVGGEATVEDMEVEDGDLVDIDCPAE